MINTESQKFFEISIGPQDPNFLKSRLKCLGDFFKKCLFFPLALIAKLGKTVLRSTAIFFSFLLLLVTLGNSRVARELFIHRIVIFAKDVADWILLPFALAWCVLRLFLALIIHPQFYFNAI